MANFEPKIVGFLCNWCSYTGADLAGTSRIKYPENIQIIRIMCSGRIDPTFILKAFREGADGVLMCGCHPGDCHYKNGNFKALRRFLMLQKYLQELGVNPKRLRLEWVSASEGKQFADLSNEFTKEILQLGPCKIKTIMETQD